MGNLIELNIETGLKTYSINGACEIQFNPTDANFVESVYDAFEKLDRQQETVKRQLEGVTDAKTIFRISRQQDTEMRGIIDGVLGEGVCEKVFHHMNIYSYADGLPVWANLMLAVLDLVDTTFADEQSKTNPRIAKYTEKYKKR